MAAVENHTVAAGVSLCSHSVFAEAVCSAAPSHRSQSCWGLHRASRAWSRRWAPLEGGRDGREEAADSGHSRNTLPPHASADPHMSSDPGRYLRGNYFMITQVRLHIGLYHLRMCIQYKYISTVLYYTLLQFWLAQPRFNYLFSYKTEFMLAKFKDLKHFLGCLTLLYLFSFSYYILAVSVKCCTSFDAGES